MKCIRTVSKCIQTVYSNCILTVSQLKNIYAVYITYIYLIHICITSFKETLEFFFFFLGGGGAGVAVGVWASRILNFAKTVRALQIFSQKSSTSFGMTEL